MTLDELVIKHGTDKARQFTRRYAKPDDYCRHLERFFEPMRNHYVDLIEIGVGGGESIKTGLDYFLAGQVYGVDLVHDTNEWNSLGPSPTDRYQFTCGSQSDPRFWNGFFGIHGALTLDIVIDDGSHESNDIKLALTCLWKHLKPGGIYVIEDLNYDRRSQIWTESLVGHIHNGTTDIDSISFSKELAILRKK